MLNEKRVLIVEDDPTIYPILARMIHRLNPRVDIEFTVSAEGAQDLLQGLRQKYDVILSDISLAGKKTGIDLANETYSALAPVPIVLTSSTPGFKSRLPFLAKPFRYEELVEKLAPYLDADAPSEEARTGKPDIFALPGDRRAEQITFLASLALALSFYFLLSGELIHLPFVSVLR